MSSPDIVTTYPVGWVSRKSAGPAGNGLSQWHQGGFTLMELMVGITIGLLVVIAAVGSLSFTQTSTTTLGDSARLQQKADAIFRNMGFNLSQAGAIAMVAAPAVSTASTAAADLVSSRVLFSSAYTGYDTSVTGAGAGQIFYVHGVDGGTSGPDTLRVSYQDDIGTNADGTLRTGTIVDCLGNRPVAGVANIRIDNQYSLSGTDLMCLGSGSATAQAIADGVEDMQVTYAVQTVAAGVLQYRYYTASTVPNWSNIQAVSVCLQLVGDSRGNPQPGMTITGCRGQTISSDGAIRRIYRRTFSMRNKLQ